MLERIRLALVNPTGLLKFYKDGVFKAFLFIGFFAMLMATPLLITTLTFDGISAQTEATIEDNVAFPDTSCQTINAALECDSDVRHAFYETDGMIFHLDSNTTLELEEYDGFVYHFVLHDESVHLVIMNTIVESRALEDFEAPVQSLNLTPTTDSEEETFYEAIFAATDEIIMDTKPLWGSLVVITNIMFNIILFLVFILINTLLSKSRLPGIPFKTVFVLMTYAATALYIVLIFNEFLTAIVGEVSFLILIIFLFVAFRQMNRMTMALYKRVNKQ
ncbi:MAG: DUF1189 family protein [Bacillota bacterium]